MNYSTKKELENLQNFILRLSLRGAFIADKVFKDPRTRNFQLDDGELSRMSATIGIPLRQMLVRTSVAGDIIEILAEEKEPHYSYRVVTVASNRYEMAHSWEDFHPEVILKCLMELRQIIADRVLKVTQSYLQLFPEDEDETVEE